MGAGGRESLTVLLLIHYRSTVQKKKEKEKMLEPCNFEDASKMNAVRSNLRVGFQLLPSTFPDP